MTFGDRLATYEPDKKSILHNVLDIGTGTGIWSIEYGESLQHDVSEESRVAKGKKVMLIRNQS